MSQLSDIRTVVQANWPANYHSTFLTNSKTDSFINQIVRWVCKGSLITPDAKFINHSFRWMKRETTASTVDSQQRYLLPAASSTIWRYKEEISCELIDADNERIPLTRRLKREIEMDTRYSLSTETGIPKEYSIDHGYIWLYPIPDHSLNSSTAWTINFEYYGYPPALSADSDTNQITNFYPEVLEYGATELGFRYGQDYEQAQYYEQEKIKEFLAMLREDQKSVLANLESGLRPVSGSNLAEGSPGFSNVYYNKTPYS